MYFIVFDHDVTDDTFYVHMSRFIAGSASTVITNAFNLLEGSTSKYHSNIRTVGLFSSYPGGALVNRYIIGVANPDMYHAEKFGIDKDLSDLVSAKLANTVFTSNVGPTPWRDTSLSGAGGYSSSNSWDCGWVSLLGCWAMNGDEDFRTGKVRLPLYSEVFTKLGISTEDTEAITALSTAMKDTAIEVLKYLMLNHTKAAFNSIIAKYSDYTTAITCDNGDSCLAKVAGRSITKSKLTITGKTLCEDCWAKYISYPDLSTTDKQDIYNAEQVRLIADGILSLDLCTNATLFAYKVSWNKLRGQNKLTLTATARTKIEEAYNLRVASRNTAYQIGGV